MKRHDGQSDDKLSRLLEIDAELDRIVDLDQLLEHLLYLARREASADAGRIYLRNGDNVDLCQYQNDTRQAQLKPGEKLVYPPFSIPIGDKSIVGYVSDNLSLLNIPDMYAIDPDASYHFDSSWDDKSGYKTVSSLTFPIVSTEDEFLGVIQLINARDDDGNDQPFQAENEPFFEVFAKFGSKGIQRAKMSRNLLETIAQFATLRGSETRTHINRIGAYSVEIYEVWANRRGIDSEERSKSKDILRMAAMLHDVGKAGISDIILKKPARLNNDEYRIMQSHTWLGARQFTDDESEWNSAARDIALYHHENWDGSGYPGRIGDLFEADKYILDVTERPPGFKGAEIPLFARIVAIADVYDALCSKLCYKEAWEENDVLTMMRDETGRKFDPELIDAFFEVLPTLRSIREKYPDTEE